MSEEEQQSQAGDTNSGTTPMRRPECYGRSRVDAAAGIPNPVYASNPGATQMSGSYADAAARIPNPMYASNAATWHSRCATLPSSQLGGSVLPDYYAETLKSTSPIYTRKGSGLSTPLADLSATCRLQPLSFWRSLQNAAAKMLNPIYTSSSADPPMDQPQTDNQARANDDENTPDATHASIQADPPLGQPQTDQPARVNDDANTPDHTYANIPDGAYPGGASGRRGVCSFPRARRSCLAAGIAVLLSLAAVGLAPLTFSNKQGISQLSTTVDALKRDQYSLKRDQDDMRRLCNTVDALKRDLHEMRRLATTVDALKRDQDDKRRLCNTVDALKRDLNKMRRLATTADVLKRDLDNERSRTASLEKRLIEKTLHGGTLATPRDAVTEPFLAALTLHSSLSFWIGLHDQREEGRYEWVDGSALGTYNSWIEGQPDNAWNEDCVAHNSYIPRMRKDYWGDFPCETRFSFICQTAPGRP
ncbi:hypothetical protein Bbelb_042050 [Branchiostoma belcheri]|nr:hypothetical protein Bbelb_042050 [Branchiostoma belcheri]